MRDLKQVIVIRKDLNMRKGKMCAQAAHASLNAVIGAEFKSVDDPIILSRWIDQGQTKIVVSVDSEKELLDLYEKVSSMTFVYLVKDAGYTEFKEPTYTALAIGPSYVEALDKLTGNLKLL